MPANENAPLAGKGEFDTTEKRNTIQDQADSQADSKPLFCSGYGQFHTDEPGKEYRKAYATIAFDDIRQLVDLPQQIDKIRAQWLIASTLPSRAFIDQEAKGEYWLLWADIDKDPKRINEVSEIIKIIIQDTDYEIYTSRSATEGDQKCRILIPLTEPLSYIDWHLYQEILNDKLQDKGMVPDRSSERAAQLCYLPNRGEFYDTRSKRDGNYFDPELWHEVLQNKHIKIKEQAEELLRLKIQAKSKRAEFESLSGIDTLPDLIGAFNSCHTAEDILQRAGYDQHPRYKHLFRHPASESGSYSASIRDGRVNTLSTSDPLYSSDGAHDAFSAYTVLFHPGDINAALKAAGDKLMFGSETWNKVKQREYAQRQQEMKFESSTDKDQSFSFAKFDITGDVEDMRKKMLDDVFVMNGIALLGQLTVIYASPNTGKTLLTISLLIDSVKAGRIQGEYVYYVNADDTHKGLITKAEIFKEFDICLIAPSHKGFEVKHFTKNLDQLIKTDTARGKIVVLDTLKKFSDLMDKTSISRFMVTARSFAAHGGTMIMLAHTNKRRDSDKKLIMGGTSDVVDDADCAFIIDAKPTRLGDTRKTIIFENIKCRGDVNQESCFSYSIELGLTYAQKLDSVQAHSQADLDSARQEIEQNELRVKDDYVIELIEEAIRNDITKKTEIINVVSKNGGGHHTKVRAVLDRYQSKLWGVTVAGDNAKIFHLIGEQATAEEYKQRKSG